MILYFVSTLHFYGYSKKIHKITKKLFHHFVMRTHFTFVQILILIYESVSLKGQRIAKMKICIVSLPLKEIERNQS